MKKKKASTSALGQTKEIKLHDMVSSAMEEYGKEVIEQRAFPEYRDGLKPVHRAILYAMYDLKMHHTGGYKKSARVVGEVIGKYHPHGDISTYGALVGLVGTRKQGSTTEWASKNCSSPLIEGNGNFGDFIDSPAAMRYCVIAGTKIGTPYVDIPIEDLPIWNSEEEKSEAMATPGYVKDLCRLVLTKDGVGWVTKWINSGLRPTLTITVKDKSGNPMSLTCTANHPFWHKCRLYTSWKEAGNLVVGDLVCIRVPFYAVQSEEAFVPVESIEPSGMAMVYDLTVDWKHNFIANGFVVHNTEVKLSPLADKVLLDPEYMAVADYVPNYDNSEKMPLVLPSKLPLVLLLGTCAIGVAVAASSPPFSLEGVIKLTKAALSGKTITEKLCAKYLEFNYPYGGDFTGSQEDLLSIMNGKGSGPFTPSYEVFPEKQLLVLTSINPGLAGKGSLQTLSNNIYKLPATQHVDVDIGIDIRIEIKAKRNVKGEEFQKFVEACLSKATKVEHFDLGVTSRELDKVSFSQPSIPTLLEEWSSWRIEFEGKVLNRLLGLTQDKLDRVELVKLAALNLDLVLAALNVKAKTAVVKYNKESIELDAGEAYLVKHMKISPEQAKSIMDMRVRSLRAVEIETLNGKIKQLSLEIKQLKADIKNPVPRILAGLDALNID